MDGRLPFLDVGICHCSDGSIETSVHRKPTHTDKYLNFISHHPLAHKRAVIQAVTSKASTHSSDSHSKSKEMNRIMSCLKLDGFPKAFIMSSQRQPIFATSTSKTEWKGIAVIPYIQGTLEHLR